MLGRSNERAGIVSALKRRMEEFRLPAGTGWPHALGGLALFLFAAQAVTGGYLALFYVASPEGAYGSVQTLIHRSALGRLAFGLHHYATNAIVVVIGLHLLRVFLWGAYKRPRRAIWAFGVFLLLLSMAFAATGVLLPWDQNGYWQTTIRFNLFGNLPLFGSAVKHLLLGGDTVGSIALSRFYALHLFILPAIFGACVLAHLIQVRLKGISPNWKRTDEEESAEGAIPFHPNLTRKVAALCLGVTLILIAVALSHQPPIEPPADPSVAFSARPDWYFLYFYRYVHLFPNGLNFFGAIFLPALLLLALFFYPYFDSNRERRLRYRPLSLLLAGGGFVLVTILGFQGLRTMPHDAALSPIESKGVTLFVDQKCQACHGINSPIPNGGTDLALAGRRSAEEIAEILRNPKKLNPRTIMPSETLSSEDADALVAFVSSIGPSSTMPAVAQMRQPLPVDHLKSDFLLNHRLNMLEDPKSCFPCHAQKDCDSCHQRRSPDSHLKDWMSRHSGAANAAKNGATCMACHAKSTCDNCHRQMMHGADWMSIHPQAAKSPANYAVCMKCHVKASCDQCHQGGKPQNHALANFMQIHGTLSKTTNCAECHVPTNGKDACMTCHQKSDPHPPGFAKTHGPVAKSGAMNCATCHDRKSFCETCHQKNDPHPSGFTKTHGQVAKSGMMDCATCHDRKSFCDACHKIAIPHPNDFAKTHAKIGMASRAICMQCHQERECESCHRTMLPSTHTPAFIAKHGAIAKKSPAECLNCHKPTDCSGCHHQTPPATHQASDFRETHGKTAIKKDANCFMCHEKKLCDACHRLPMPHPQDWAMNHADAAKKNLSVCANCHKKADCAVCHGDDGPKLPASFVKPKSGDSLPALIRALNETGAGRCPVWKGASAS